jgi:serine/threonine-protein kinase HipA
MTKPTALIVQLQSPHGTWIDVGTLYNLEVKNWFEFFDDYWSMGDRPILGQIFEEKGAAWQPTAHVALPRWFSHLLPEGYLREAVAAAAGINKAREFNLIARLGLDDLPGALRLRPATRIPGTLIPPEVEQAESWTTESDPLTKFSLAGTQLKFSIYRTSAGLTIPIKGQAGNAIAKLPDGRPGYSGVPEAELACLNLAASMGIDVPPRRLAPLSSISGLQDWAAKISELALIVDRFDRMTDDRRVHMEELAQILDIPTAREDAKYLRANLETVASYVGALSGVESVGQVIDRIVLNVLVGNGDAHLKNWAVLYPDGVTPVLSPLYDVLPTILYLPSDDMGLKLAGSRDFESVRLSSFDRLAARTGYGVRQAGERARDAVERALTHWTELRELLSGENYARLTSRRDRLPIVSGRE